MIERGWRIPVFERGIPSPWDVGLPYSVYLSSPKKAVASSEPNFWPHSLQIHCNGLCPKPVTLQLVPSVGSFLCDDECDSLLRRGQTPKGRR